MPTPKAKKTASAEEKLSNRFAGLDVYEPSQEFLDAPDIERPVKAKEDNAVYEAETDVSIENAFFALNAAINDMDRVRARIQWIWSNYKRGVFDLVAAAIATNTAIELVRNLLDDIVPLLARHGGVGEMLHRFYALQCLEEGWSADNFTVGADKDFHYETYDIGNKTYFTVYRLLLAFIDVLQPGRIPLYKEGTFGYYDPTSDRSRKTGWEKYTDDRALLMPFFTELMTVIRGMSDWPAKDAFLHGMEELSQTKEVPFYAVFAAQIFLDITYELKEDIVKPFNTLVAHTTVMDNDIKSHFDFHAELKIKIWPASNDQWIRQLQQSIRWLAKDPLRTAQAKLYRGVGMELGDKETHRLYRMSPLTCGLFLYHYRSRYHDVGLAVANAWGSIQYCEHLYNALFHEGLLDDKWPDMDILITMLGEDSFFVGGELPATPQDYLRKFCLQMGTSPAAMIKGGRKNTSLHSKAGPRGLKEDASPVLSMFQARYVENSRQVDFTPEQVSQILALSRFEHEEGDGGYFKIGQIEDPKKLEEKKKLQHQLKSGGPNRAAKKSIMPLDQLLKPLVFALHVETLEYAYPYLSMHRWCWQLLRMVKDLCDPALRQIFTPAYMQKETELPWVVGWIFSAATGPEDRGPDRRPLQLAADAMNILLDSGASAVICEKVLGEKLKMPIKFNIEDGTVTFGNFRS
ncbi:hypothetical protein ONZ43_g5150 [Nemania bipapillata]|uniref:Uncharacterized protein n=1 Tax=Nemania bipapillata TaxID=110536 RepID=A0ACC2IE88_9PEZI|nr:hypothetical protein ONZ43_g5150 [Nemania bipapillata]